MPAPRATQTIALRNWLRGSPQVRRLHMTGPAPCASPILHKDRPVLNLPRALTGLGAECTRGAFSPAISNTDRPTAEHESASKPTVRHLNTSRALKANKDSSTIDFAYLPHLTSPENIHVHSHIRVPIISTLDARAPRHAARDPDLEAAVMKPQINPMSADAVYMPFSDSADGHAQNIDFYALADRVAWNLRQMAVPVEQQASVIKQVWTDMVDDMLGREEARHVPALLRTRA